MIKRNVVIQTHDSRDNTPLLSARTESRAVLKPCLSWQLQTHFDNPSHKSGRVDNSGIRIFYTSKKRQYEVCGVPRTTVH